MTRVGQGQGAVLAAIWLAAVLLLISALAWFLDVRTLDGVSVWAKPMKFNVSFALHLVTVFLFVRLLLPEARHDPRLKVALVLMALATIVELGYIFLQAARGRASHFNFETPWEEAFYYGVMGCGALIVVAATIVVGVFVWIQGDPRFGPGLRLGATLGAVFGALATLVTAGALASGAVTGTGHWVGGVLSDADGLPFVGWSTTGGDLRVPHFFATHLLQVLPLFGFAVDRLRLPQTHLFVTAGLAAGVSVIATTFFQAARGEPFFPAISEFARTVQP